MTNWREYGEEERACQSECRHCLMGGWTADMSKQGRRMQPAGLALVLPSSGLQFVLLSHLRECGLRARY
jgi:hypothetical protein